jgi:hypothetical protein
MNMKEKNNLPPFLRQASSTSLLDVSVGNFQRALVDKAGL